MNELREQIDQEVYEAYQAGIDHKEVSWKYPAMTKGDIREATDRILALIAEAMLSDEAVDAAVVRLWGEKCDVGVIAPTVIKAALTAAGVTGAGQEGGEGE